MKHYAVAMVNIATNEIEHIATSQAPLSDDKVGKPDNWETTHRLVRFEFNAEPDTGHNLMRARTALEQFEISGQTPILKNGASKAADIVSGKTFAEQVVEYREAKAPKEVGPS